MLLRGSVSHETSRIVPSGALSKSEYSDLDHLRENIAEFDDSYYNRVRLHSALGYKPPATPRHFGWND